MKTYAESIGHRPFNWLVALKDARKGLASPEDVETMKKAACQWPTCACGNMCDLLPRGRPAEQSAPLDDDLYFAGLNFAEAVDCEDWIEAIRIFHAIEARSTHLLQEMGLLPPTVTVAASEAKIAQEGGAEHSA